MCFSFFNVFSYKTVSIISQRSHRVFSLAALVPYPACSKDFSPATAES